MQGFVPSLALALPPRLSFPSGAGPGLPPVAIPLCSLFPTGMVWRFPRHHPATALAGALGCRGSAKGRRLW